MSKLLRTSKRFEKAKTKQISQRDQNMIEQTLLDQFISSKLAKERIIRIRTLTVRTKRRDKQRSIKTKTSKTSKICGNNGDRASETHYLRTYICRWIRRAPLHLLLPGPAAAVGRAPRSSSLSQSGKPNARDERRRRSFESDSDLRISTDSPVFSYL